MRFVMPCVFVPVIALVIAAAHRVGAEDAAKASGLAQTKLSYAQALVKLEEADLRKAQDANAQAPAAVPASVIRMLESDISMAKARARALEDGSATSGEASYVTVARDALAATEQALKQATEVNAKVSGTFNAAEIARRQAQVELARARLDVAQQLEKATPEERMQWEVLVLQQEVHDLRFAVELLQHHN
jgi:hypothetical protein